ncbi:sulfotransferase domain-containing protein [Shewanella sp. 6_MG-2023]|uniref:sulfotransferase domain-containing protein n=1 Tax=Shewanella sp. 6_MG-2023 TaxID=3062660 RepID=UPI0026E41C4E|nr:sulfotransferase domain-containing protein [Shewanella sp. 6_MG-2023]MDO6617614.1 sulfotransferase domain-containing protein [Shewanella sp. 6_MG-2023]
MKKIIEIASYPKCGNTWMRQLIANTFDLNVNTDVPDVHQQKENTKELMAKVSLADDTYFYKSHLLDNQTMNPDKIIYIYRHPLDVFFSSLNYFYIRENVKNFKDEKLKSVEQIYKDGEMPYYFDAFNDNLGKEYYRGLLGDASDYSNYVKSALSNPKIIKIRYEDLVDNPESTFKNLLGQISPDFEVQLPESLFEDVNAVTKNSKKAFFWKAGKETYKEFLSTKQIELFNDKHHDLLQALGYYSD